MHQFIYFLGFTFPFENRNMKLKMLIYRKSRLTTNPCYHICIHLFTISIHKLSNSDFLILHKFTYYGVSSRSWCGIQCIQVLRINHTSFNTSIYTTISARTLTIYKLVEFHQLDHWSSTKTRSVSNEKCTKSFKHELKA